MFACNFTGNLHDLMAITHLCEISGRWYYSQPHNTYVLSAEDSEVTWNATTGVVNGIAQTLDETKLFYEVLAMFERQMAQGARLALPTPSRTVEILPLPTKHSLHYAYTLLRALTRDASAPQSKSLDGAGAADDAASTAGASGKAFIVLNLVAKPKTPTQNALCDRFSPHLDRAERASVVPEVFEEWLGRDTLDAWSRAARKIRMFCEAEEAFRHHNYLSDKENAEIDTYLARSALH